MNKLNEINPLFEAMSEIDDNIVANAAETSKHPFILKTGMIAAAAAILALMAGFTVYRNYIPGVEIDERLAFPYNTSVQEDLLFPSRDEMLEWGAAEYGNYDDHMFIFRKNTMPSDLFDKFNFRPLLNDNFTEEMTEVLAHAVLARYDYAPDIQFSYKLTDNRLGVPVAFHVKCYYEENIGMFSYYEDMSDRNYEILDLNDGSKAIITDYDWGQGIQATADFSYGGMIYLLFADVDVEGMKVILEDLEVL